jgi:hypothetical protein
MKASAICLIICSALVAQEAAPKRPSDPTAERHLRELMETLPAGSRLRGLLERGYRGNGVHYPWMDEMRKEGVRRVVAEVGFVWRHKPEQMSVVKIMYFNNYDDGLIADKNKLDQIYSSGLEEQLKREAIRRASSGYWIDIPKPTPNPLHGGTRVELFDDEWLPVPSPRFWAHNPDVAHPTPPKR